MSEILGNDDVRTRLLTLAEQGALHHCLLFEGPVGVGKATAARWLAKAVNCQPPATLLGPGPRPCGSCWSCRAIDNDQHPDIIRVGLDPERTAPIISVRQARELISKLALRPFRAQRRFVIIDPVDAMRTETANALLKTFEEPPSDTSFMLIGVSAQRLLPTVRSRCQRIRFRPVDIQTLSRWLHEHGIDNADWIARLSDGCPGRALELSERTLSDLKPDNNLPETEAQKPKTGTPKTGTQKTGGSAETWRTIRDDLLQALEANASDRFLYTERMTKASKGRAEWTPRVEMAIDTLERLCRDALFLHAGMPSTSLYNQDRIQTVEEWAGRLQIAGCLRIADAIETARRDLEAYVNGRLLLDALLARVNRELR